MNLTLAAHSLGGANELICFGGEHFDGKLTRFFNDLYRVELRQRDTVLQWRQVTSSTNPAPRSSHQACITSGQQVFLFGGEFGTSRETKFFHYRDFWQLDLKTYAWAELTDTVKPLPGPRSGHRMALWKHVIALFGGFYDAGADTKYLDDLWLFDTREHRWTRADWLNDANCRPSARSGFHLVPVDTGLLLYGGYCQARGKGGAATGQVLTDMWHLRVDTEDLRRTRWEKRKISGAAASPQPRSGGCSVASRSGRSFYLFGGVVDEDISEEFLNGTCLNDLWEFSVERGQWRQLAPRNAPVPRYNAALSLLGSKLVLFAGIHEHEDRQYVLDDCWVLNVDKIDGADGWQCVRKLSVDLSTWQGDSDSDGSDGSDGSDDSDESDEEDSSGDESDDSEDQTDSEYEDDDAQARRPCAMDPSVPLPCPGQTLRDYFSAHQPFWQQRAQALHPTLTNSKQLRGEAFVLAQQAFNEFDLDRLLLK